VFYKGWNNIHLLNSLINEAGVNYLSNISPLVEKDLINNLGTYFINIPENIPNIKKIINLKLLNYLKVDNKIPKFIVEHNTSRNNVGSSWNKKIYNSFSYLNFPNSNFFESSGNYLNTEGYFRRSVKIVSTGNEVKEDWEIFRKLFQYSGKVSYISDLKYNKLLHFNLISYSKFKNFVGFLYYPSSSLSKSNVCLNRINMSNTFYMDNKIFKISRMKIYDTPLRFRIQDFFIGGKDFYSSNSLTMVKCSKYFRESFKNFGWIVPK